MKYLSLLAVMLSVTMLTAPVSAVEYNAHTGFQFDWWDSDDDRKATQFSIPLTIKGEHQNYSLSLLTGFARTSIELSDGTDESLSSLLDTKLNFSYDVPGQIPLDILIGLDLNIPTGKTNLSQEELILIMDPDLISITTFGEGFNINPTINVVKKWTDWVAGMGIGYLYRGEYDFSENIKSYNPGNVINASAEARYYSQSDWDARVFGYFAHYFKDKQDGTEIAQEGKRFLIGFGLNYDQVEWVAGATVRAVFRDKISKLRETAGGPSDITQGNEWVGDLYYIRELNSFTTLKTTFQGTYIGENDEASGSDQFVGSRKKFTLGIGATRKFENRITAEANIKGFIMNDAETEFPESRDSTSYKGLVAMISVSKGF
ncbi:MAG: hypothetical protein JSW20_13610 [Nitrospiraceae bacterium]|nr:MAG: hypothetical protein JSW20_13610 [Nitrospiraceae bacterium]